ncbi:hypothetical protein VTK56DRAFT_7494 [Thermocarpiscus australiensis]
MPPLSPPPIPFPFPLRVGTDICRVGRVARILRGARGPRFIRRVLAPEELASPRPAVAAILGGRVAAASAAAAAIEAVQGGRGGGGRGCLVQRKVVEGEGRRGLGRSEEGWAAGRREDDGDGDELILRQAAFYLAGRFAAKEAAFKAHPHRGLTFHDILILTAAETQGRKSDETSTGGTGVPMALIKGGQGERDQMAMVSISHDGDYATAVCIGFDPGQVEEGGKQGDEKSKGSLFSWLFRRYDI